MKRSFFCFVLIMLVAVLPVFSQTLKSDFDPKTVTGYMEKFTSNLALSLPFNSSIGLNWSDAFVGKNPHFAVGAAFGYTIMELGAIDKLFDLFSPALPDWLGGFGGFPIPGWSLEGRIGGWVIPFDIGLKFGILPLKGDNMKKNNIELFNYLMVGADFRWSILDTFIKDEELLEKLPLLSLSMGFNHLNGALGLSAGNDKVFYYNSANDYITVKAPKFTLDWKTESMDFKFQISKKLAIFTPYFGLGLSNGWSKAGFELKTKIEDSAGNLDNARNEFEKAGISNLSSSGFSSSSPVFSGFSSRLFTGFSLTAALVKFDFSYMLNFLDLNYGVSFGIRFQK